MNVTTEQCPVCLELRQVSSYCMKCNGKICGECIGVCKSTSVKCPFCRTFYAQLDMEFQNSIDTLLHHFDKIEMTLQKIDSFERISPLEYESSLEATVNRVMRKLYYLGCEISYNNAPPQDRRDRQNPFTSILWLAYFPIAFILIIMVSKLEISISWTTS